jgi:transposase
MVFRHISEDLKERATILAAQGWLPEDIWQIFGISKRSLERWQRNLRQYGTVIRPLHRPVGRPRTVNRRVANEVIALVRESPDIYIREIQEWLAIGHDIGLSRASVSRLLSDCNLTYKRLRKTAAERDEAERQTWRDDIQRHLRADQCVCVDETSRDDRVVFRLSGHAPSGERAVIPANFGHGLRFSFVASLTIDGYIARRVVPQPYWFARIKKRGYTHSSPIHAPRDFLMHLFRRISPRALLSNGAFLSNSALLQHPVGFRPSFCHWNIPLLAGLLCVPC